MLVNELWGNTYEVCEGLWLSESSHGWEDGQNQRSRFHEVCKVRGDLNKRKTFRNATRPCRNNFVGL